MPQSTSHPLVTQAPPPSDQVPTVAASSVRVVQSQVRIGQLLAVTVQDRDAGG